MIRRGAEALGATLLLLAMLPVLTVAAIGVWISSPGPILYRARRMGLDRRKGARNQVDRIGPERRKEQGYRGREFTLYKFRTMYVSSGGISSPITSSNDSRVFPLGKLMRVTKIDELPQLINIVKGEMAFVGPRPEAIEIVRKFYTTKDLVTLRVLPGLTSPGTLYFYTHGESQLTSNDVMQHYVERLLPLKLAIDRVYIDNVSLAYDLRIVLRTLIVLTCKMIGRQRFDAPPELACVPVRPDRST
jgi:lipopolysaccharide/colanic/teichoic acid biosynthesis glycosyltransferase